jgi:hypothetical protein
MVKNTYGFGEDMLPQEVKNAASGKMFFRMIG